MRSQPAGLARSAVFFALHSRRDPIAFDLRHWRLHAAQARTGPGCMAATKRGISKLLRAAIASVTSACRKGLIFFYLAGWLCYRSTKREGPYSIRRGLLFFYS